jgi:hypothetical protein
LALTLKEDDDDDDDDDDDKNLRSLFIKWQSLSKFCNHKIMVSITGSSFVTMLSHIDQVKNNNIFLPPL